MDWSEFETSVTVPLYLEYMIRMNKLPSILSPLSDYMKRFDSTDYYFKGYQISEAYELSEGEKEGLI